MKAGEFPKIWEYETPEKKREAQESLPVLLRQGMNYFLKRRIQEIEDYEEKHGSDGETQKQIVEINNLDRESLFEKLQGKLFNKQPLETVVLFDLISWFMKENLEDALQVKMDDKLGVYPPIDWKKIGDFLNKYTYQRDRLIDEIPELDKIYIKQDFEKWLAERLKIQEDALKGIDRKKETQNFYDNTPLVYKILDHVSSGRVLADEEIKILLNLIDEEIKINRETARDCMSEYFLGQSYDVEELEYLEKQILKFRQFKVQVESGEWVKIHSAV